MQGKRRLMCSGEIDKNKMIKNIMKRQVFFSYLTFRMAPYFVYENTCSSPPMQLFMLLVQEGNIQTNIKGKDFRSSLSQMFFKKAVLKNIPIFTRKYLCWSLSLIKWQAILLLSLLKFLIIVILFMILTTLK